MHSWLSHIFALPFTLTLADAATPTLPVENNVALTVMVGLATAILGAVATYLAEEARSKSRYSQLVTKYQQLAQNYEAFQAGCTYYTYSDFGVVLDGIQSSGKSAIVAKWADPTVDISKLTATAGLLEIGVYLCSRFFNENDRHREERYRLKFLDVPGEQPELIMDSLLESRCHFVLLVVDPSQEVASFARLNPTHLKTLYTASKVVDHVSAILVYVSKSDLMESDELRRIRERIEKEIVSVIKHRYDPNIYIFQGSAKDGRGLHDALAFMVQRLGLAPYFTKHQSVLETRRS